MNDPYDTTAGTSGTTWKYAYDQGGNIQSKTAYAFTTGTVGSAIKTDSFTYGDANWKDKLTAFNGQTITYDEIGNPTNDGTWNYTWIGGRQMRAMYKGEFGEQGYDEITFEYNENGLRTKKTRMYYDDATGDIGYKATNYTLHGKNIVHLSDGSNNLHFFYDAQNKPAVVIFNGTAYAYLYNLQGDVIGLVDSNGTKMVSYTYDAWGKPISKTGTLASTLGTIQPFRYRGYVYDEEMEFYYVENRYYASLWLRFVNADNVIIPTSISLSRFVNLYTYCNNAPVINMDNGGHWSLGCLFSGVLNVVIGAAAVITACGALAAIPVASVAFTVAYVSVAVVTGVAGAASVITGSSNAFEGITGYNPIRDNLPNEDWQNGYDIVSGMSPVVATMGAYSLAPFMVHPPKEARDTASYVKQNNSAPPGHSSAPHKGHELKQLGVTAQSYMEYDIYANRLPKDRGLERIVVDSNNRVYYTNDHYTTFWRMMFIK